MTDTCIKTGPVYHDLVEDLQRRIIAGDMQPGQMLGTELGFAKEAGISRVSARRAVDQLVDAGLAERRAGKGVFVAEQKQTARVEVVVPSLNHDQWIQVWRGIRDFDTQGRAMPRIYDAHGSLAHHIQYIRSLADQGAGGAIIGHLSHSDFPDAVLELYRLDFPMVLIDAPLGDWPIPAVHADHYGGGYTAGRELVALGHKRIGFIGNMTARGLTSRLRSEGLRDAVLDAGLPFDRSLICDLNVEDPLGDWKPAIRRCVRDLAGRSPRPTALFLNNDAVAVTAYDELEKLGLSIPDDISVVGFGNERSAALLTPSLSTIAVDRQKVGAQSLRVLLEVMDDYSEKAPHTKNHPKPVRQVIPTSWLPRESIKKL